MDRDLYDDICAYCEKASALNDEDYMLCKKHGVVKKSHYCKKFSFDPLKHVPPQSSKLPEVDFIQIDD